MNLPPELNFLSSILVDPKDIYRKASWLLSDFNAMDWQYTFNYDEPKSINWKVILEDGSYLTEDKNKLLLDGFKYYLTSCTESTSSEHNRNNEIRGQWRCFQRACHIVDFLLIRSKRYQLASYGLEGLTSGNLIEILQTIASSTSAAESIYNWSHRLSQYCLDLLERTDNQLIFKTLKENPHISLITTDQLDDDTLGLPQELIPKIRAALFLNKSYYNKLKDGRFQPNTILISQEIYRETIYGKNQLKPAKSILFFSNDFDRFTKEFRSVSLTTGSHEKIRDATFSNYRNSLYRLGVLHELSLPAPCVEALIESRNFLPDLSVTGRFRSLPSEMVFMAIRQAIEFHLDYGELLIRAFCRVALECRKRKTPPQSLTNDEVQTIVGTKLRNFGVRLLSLSIHAKDEGTLFSTFKGEKTDYFHQLRSNYGVYELIAIYIGGVQLTTGVLMARRVSELCHLHAANCLDITEQWLLFRNAKSTRHLFGFRREEARPIEPIVAEMVKTLIRMQKILCRIGYIDKLQTLFSVPDFRGGPALKECTAYVYNRNLDIFCDYFETPRNSAGERYYFRQHQIRRFFAMLFFYCGSFSKLETLQWMLGHTDPIHVYRYITESTDGAVLASAKAHYVAEQLHYGDLENYQALADLLKQRYGSDDFSLTNTNDLEDHIQDLVNEGWIEIEPEFFTDHQKTTFKVVARLIKTSVTA